MADWRSVFCKQPSHFLILDITSPMTAKLLSQLCESLFNMLAISCNLKGPDRFLDLGITLIGNGKIIRNVVPLLSVKTNYGQFKTGIASILDLYKSVTAGDGQSLEYLEIVLQEAMIQYVTRSKQAHSFGEVPVQMQVTLVTAQTSKTVVRRMEAAVEKIDTTCIRKIQVVSVIDKLWSKPFESREGSPDLWNSNSQDSMRTAQAFGANIEVISITQDTLQMEHFFKRWLQDSNTDMEHVRILIRSGQDSFLLKCDLQEIALNPQLLPTTGQFHLSTDALSFQVNAGQNKSGTGQRVPIYEMEGAKLFKLSGVCESVLFGQPLVLWPTQCWKMDWEELESNQETFNALNQILTEKDSGLLLRRCDQFAPVGRGHVTAAAKHLNGYFLVIPCKDNQSMLIKPILTRELLLPVCSAYEALGSAKPSEEAMGKVSRALSSLQLEEDYYNPLDQSCGLYDQLTATMTKSRPQKRQHYLVASVTSNAQDSFYSNH